MRLLSMCVAASTACSFEPAALEESPPTPPVALNRAESPDYAVIAGVGAELALGPDLPTSELILRRASEMAAEHPAAPRDDATAWMADYVRSVPDSLVRARVVNRSAETATFRLLEALSPADEIPFQFTVEISDFHRWSCGYEGFNPQVNGEYLIAVRADAAGNVALSFMPGGRTSWAPVDSNGIVAHAGSKPFTLTQLRRVFQHARDTHEPR